MFARVQGCSKLQTFQAVRRLLANFLNRAQTVHLPHKAFQNQILAN